jgi:hypothetical protein
MAVQQRTMTHGLTAGCDIKSGEFVYISTSGTVFNYAAYSRLESAVRKIGTFLHVRRAASFHEKKSIGFATIDARAGGLVDVHTHNIISSETRGDQ